MAQTVIPTPKGGKVRVKTTRAAFVKGLREQYILLIFLLPGVCSFLLFNYIPVLGNIIAFQNYNPVFGVFGSRLVGWENFIRIINMPSVLSALRNTLIISSLKLIFVFPSAIIFALLVNEVRNLKLKKAIQTASYLPYFLSWVVAAGLWYKILSPSDGVANHLLMALRLIDEPIYFMGKPQYFYPIIVLSDIWKGVGWNAIIYIAAIASISPDLYEAATMDGANKLQKTWHITLPGIKPTIILLLIMAVSSILNAGFDQVYTMQNNVVMNVSDILDTLILRTLTVGGMRDMAYGAAIGLIKSVFGILLFITVNKGSRWLFGESML
ncbi:MAG TPA: ABC transporter permease subunit [Clostridia bacterium]|nr:ABC transporter permease subunit [Clostridia bacterium]